MRTTTVIAGEEIRSAVRLRTQRRENNRALCTGMYAQLLSMSALELLSVASTGAYFSALLTAVPLALLYFLSSLCAKRRAYAMPRALEAVFALLFFSDMAVCMLSLTELVCAYVLPGTPRLAVALASAGLTGIFLTGRRRGGARRCAACLTGFFLTALIVCLWYALPEGEAGHLFPLLGYGGGQILRGGVYMLGGVWSAGALPFFAEGKKTPEMKKERPYLLPLLTLLLFALLMFLYAFLLPSPLLPGKWGFVLQLQLIMEMSPSILSWSLMLISRMLLFLSAFAAAGDSACECLHRALKKRSAPILPLMLVSALVVLIPLHSLRPVLRLALPLRYLLCLFSVTLALFVRKKEISA